MARRKEIKFKNVGVDMRGKQNGLTFWIHQDINRAVMRAPAYYVSVYPGAVNLPVFSTGGRQYFGLAGAKEFCQKIAAGEIKIESLPAELEAEDVAEEQAVIREEIEQAKKFYARLVALGLKYTDLLELEALAHRLGDTGHNILLGYERGEGWPSGT